MALELENIPKKLDPEYNNPSIIPKKTGFNNPGTIPELSKVPKRAGELFTNEFIRKCNGFLCEVPDEAPIRDFKVPRQKLSRFIRFSESRDKVFSNAQKKRDAEYQKIRLAESKKKGPWFKIFQELSSPQRYDFNLLLESAAKKFGTVEKIRSLNTDSEPIEYHKILNKLFEKNYRQQHLKNNILF